MSDEQYPPEVSCTGEWRGVKYWCVKPVHSLDTCKYCAFENDATDCHGFRTRSFGCIGKGIIIRPENYDDYVVARVTHALGLDTEA